MLGTSFSPRHAQSLDLDPHLALQRVLALGLAPIRLGAYWDQIQPTQDRWDFSELQWQLDLCQEHGVAVVLTVGVKAPRWPEFYEPEWAQELSAREYESAVLAFVERTVLWAQNYSCLHVWQVENEPLDPSGPHHRTIPLPLLQQEVEVVRRTDSQRRPILLTAWGNELLVRRQLPRLHPLGDVIGIDLYPKVFWKRVLYTNFFNPSLAFWSTAQTQVKRLSKPLWIAELQAEPWEDSPAGYLGPDPKSLNPSQLIANWRQSRQLPAEVVLLWGCEYWLWREDHGDSRFVQIVKQLVKRS